MGRKFLKKEASAMSCPLCKPAPAAHLWREREKTLAWEGEPVLVYTVRALALPSVPARVERCYRRVEAVWAARWEKSLYPRACAALRAARAASRPFRPWEASLSASVTLDTPERLSLYWEAAERLDGPHAVTLRRGDAWALPRGMPLTLAELFPAGFRWRRWVLEEAARQLRARQASGESRFWPDWERRLARSFDPERFFLTEEGPSVFFPLYALGPHVEGIPTLPLRLPAQEEAPVPAQF